MMQCIFSFYLHLNFDKGKAGVDFPLATLANENGWQIQQLLLFLSVRQMKTCRLRSIKKKISNKQIYCQSLSLLCANQSKGKYPTMHSNASSPLSEMNRHNRVCSILRGGSNTGIVLTQCIAMLVNHCIGWSLFLLPINVGKAKKTSQIHHLFSLTKQLCFFRSYQSHRVVH